MTANGTLTHIIPSLLNVDFLSQYRLYININIGSDGCYQYQETSTVDTYKKSEEILIDQLEKCRR